MLGDAGRYPTHRLNHANKTPVQYLVAPDRYRDGWRLLCRASLDVPYGRLTETAGT